MRRNKSKMMRYDGYLFGRYDSGFIAVFTHPTPKIRTIHHRRRSPLMPIRIQRTNLGRKCLEEWGDRPVDVVTRKAIENSHNSICRANILDYSYIFYRSK
ncbi:MAG: hypothetical protein WBB82_06130 [Limnothrix sp.]